MLFVLVNRAGNGLTAMISDKINQWTLLVGMLPLAEHRGGYLAALPLDARQQEEFLPDAAQSLFGVALLLSAADRRLGSGARLPVHSPGYFGLLLSKRRGPARSPH